MNKYSVLVVGMGKRGMHHATAFNANPRFQVAGICDIDQKRLTDAAGKLGNPQTGIDAAALAKTLRPDVFCFCTMPHLRTPFIRAAIDGGAKLIAFEKPIALTSAELFSIRDLLKKSDVKAVVSHQHRYGQQRTCSFADQVVCCRGGDSPTERSVWMRADDRNVGRNLIRNSGNGVAGRSKLHATGHRGIIDILVRRHAG